MIAFVLGVLVGLCAAVLALALAAAARRGDSHPLYDQDNEP
jgi:hypothetical protein